jgi:hypothetical protein
MGRNPKHLLPQMRLHAQSGHARVRINGKAYWLGRFGSPEAKAAYDRLIAEYLAARGAVPGDAFRTLGSPISHRGDRGAVCHEEPESGSENPGQRVGLLSGGVMGPRGVPHR